MSDRPSDDAQTPSEPGADPAAVRERPLPEALARALAALEREPATETCWDDAERAARALQRPEEVADAFAKALQRIDDRFALELLAPRAVRFVDEWFGDSAHRVPLLDRALAVDPEADWAFQRLVIDYTSAARWHDLLALYDRAIDATRDGFRRRTLLEESANVARDFARDDARAIVAMQRLIEIDPDHSIAAPLERLLTDNSRHRDLISLWLLRIDRVPPETARDLQVRVACAWFDGLRDAEAALAACERVMRAGNLSAELLALLERIGHDEGVALGPRHSALLALHDHFKNIGAATDRERILLALVQCTEGDERVAVHRELAERFARTERVGDAMAQLGAALGVDPTCFEVSLRLRELADASGDHSLHAAMLIHAADAVGTGEHAAALLSEAAHVHLDVRNDAESARAAFLRALTVAGDSEGTALPIARAVLGLLDPSEHGRDRVFVLERIALLAEDRQAWADAARLAEKLGETERALACWRHRLDRDSRDTEALDASIALLETAQRWPELAIALRARVDAARPPLDGPPSIPPPPGRPKKPSRAKAKKRVAEPVAPTVDPRLRSDLVQLATLTFDKLGDVDAATDVWRDIVRAFGPDAESDDALADLARARGDQPGRLAALEAALTRASTPPRRAVLLARLGDAHRDEAPSQAAALYTDALALDAATPVALDGLRALLDEGRAAVSSVDALTAAYASTGDHAGLLAILEHRIRAARSAAERAAILLESAALHERAGAQDEAVLLLRRAFEQTPGDPDIEARILAHARTNNAWQAAVDAYRRAAETATDPVLVARLRVRTGMALESAGQPAQAYETFAAVLDERPADVDAATGAIRSAAAQQHWDDVCLAMLRNARALEELVPAVVEAAAQAAAQGASWDAATAALASAVATSDLPPTLAAQFERQVGAWQRDHRDDRDAAEAAFHRAVAHHANAAALRDLAALQRAHADRSLYDTLARLADIEPGDPGVPLEMAHVALDVLGDTALAREALVRFLDVLLEIQRLTPATAFAPADPCWALDHLVAIDKARGEADACVPSLRATEGFTVSSEGRLARRHAAELAARALDNPTLAIELYSALHRDAPDDHDALAALAALFEATDQPDEWLAAVERRLARASHLDERLAARLEVARAHAARDDRAGVVSALRENLVDRPGHPASLAALAERYESDSRHSDLVALLTTQAELLDTDVPDQAVGLWRRAASVFDEHLGDLDAALECHQRVIAHGVDVEALDAIARIHVARGEHALAARALETLRPLAREEDMARYTVRLGRALYASQQRDRALEVLRLALASAPEANDLRTLLAELLRTEQSWDALAALLTEGAEYARSDAARAGLLRDAATLHVERRGDPGAAIPLLERAAALLPGDTTLRVALAASLRAASRLDEATTLLEGLLQEFGRRRPPERALVHLELARIARAREQLAPALEQLDLASSMDMVHTGILRMLGDLSRDSGDLDRAERAFRTLLMIVRRHDPNRDDGTSDDSVGPSEIQFELHRLAERQDPARKSRELLEAAFDLAAHSVPESRRLERALRRAGATDLLLRALRARLGRAKDPETCADALSDLADALDAVPGSEAEALDARLQAIGNAPRAAALYDKMLAAARRTGQLDAYVSLLGELADRARDDGATDLAVDVLVRLGEVEAEQLGRLDRALEALRKADSLGGTNHRVLFALERTQLRLGDQDGRLATLRRIVDAAPSAIDASRRVDALYRLAEVQLASDALRAEGIRAVAAALDREPRADRAATLLRDAVLLAPGDIDLVQLYVHAARMARDDGALLAALELRIALPDAPLELIREAASLAQRVAPDRVDALLACAVERARAAENNLASADWALLALFDRARDRGDTVAARDWLREAVLVARMNPADVDRWHLLGRLATGPAGDLELAAGLYEHLRERAPNDRASWEPLLETYRRLGDVERLERTLRLVADGLFDPTERSALRLERARLLLDRADRLDESIAALRYVLGDDPANTDAAGLLRQVLRRTGRMDELSALLEQLLSAAQHAGDRARVVDLSAELGPLLETTHRERAIEVYNAASAIAPGDRALIEPLLRLLGDDAVDPRRAEALERLLALEKGRTAAGVCLTLAALRTQLGDTPGTIRALERGLEAAPGDASVTSQLEGHYRALGDWTRLADLFDRDASSRESSAEAVGRLREAAALRRDPLNDASAAAATLRRARSLAPTDMDLLADYTDALRDAGDAATAVIEIGTALARGVGDPALHATLLVRRAALQTAAGKDDAAFVDLEKAFALSMDVASAPMLAHLEARRAAAAARQDEAAEGAAVLALAGVAARTGDSAGAAYALGRWLAAHPRDLAGWRALQQVHFDAGVWSAAADVARRRLAVEQGPGLEDAAITLADACAQLERPGDAREGLESVLRDQPRSEAVRDRLAALYDAAGDHRALAALSLAAVDTARDDIERFKLLLRAGETLLRTVGDAEASLEPLQRAWQIRPGDIEATVHLADALVLLRRLTEAEAVLRQAVDAAKGRRSRDLAQVQHRLARIAQSGGDDRAALQWLAIALDSDFQNGLVASEVVDAAMALGEDEIALKALRALALMKNPQPMTRGVAFVRQGQIALKQGDKKKAMFFARKALGEDAQLPEAQELFKRAE